MRSSDNGNSWKDISNGIDAKHKLTDISFSAHFSSNHTLYLSSDGDGIYKSEDSGISWKTVNRGIGSLQIQKLFSLPDNQLEIIFASGTNGGLYRSADQEENWESIFEGPVKFNAMTYTTTLTKPIFYLGSSTGKIYVSKDLGKTWEILYSIEDSGGITCMAASKHQEYDSTVIVGTENRGLFLSNDGGRSFIAVNVPASAPSVQSVVLSPNFEKDSVAFASFWYDAIYKSIDGGNTWIKNNSGLTTDSQADTGVHRSPHFTNIAFTETADGISNVFLAGFDGLFKSENDGTNWFQLETLSVARVMDVAVSQVCDNSFYIGITTYGGGSYIMHYPDHDWEICNHGLETTRLTGFCFSSNFCSDKSFFSAVYGHLLQYNPVLNQWNAIDAEPDGMVGFRRKLFRYLRHKKIPTNFLDYFFSEKDGRTLYPSDLVLSPAFSKDSTIFFTTRRHGIFAHQLDKDSTRLINEDIGMTSSFVVSPSYGYDSTLFAAERGRGVFISTDGGSTWKTINNGIHFLKEWEEAFNQNVDYKTIIGSRNYSLILRISPDYANDRTLFLFCGEGVYKSMDSGKHWDKLFISERIRNNLILDLAVSPNYVTDKTIMISVKGNGLFKSNDGGKTFSPIGRDLVAQNHEIFGIAFAPLNAPGNIIVARSEENLFLSENGGVTWQHVKRPVRYENSRDVVHFHGNWDIIKSNDFSAQNASYGKDLNSKVALRFFGTGITWIGKQSNQLGSGDVFIDGRFIACVNQYGIEEINNKECFSISDLPLGPHVIEIVVSPNKSSQENGRGIIVDCFDVYCERN
jgi:photosystem II stability/assembly factor-like uncharacterized protein